MVAVSKQTREGRYPEAANEWLYFHHPDQWIHQNNPLCTTQKWMTLSGLVVVVAFYSFPSCRKSGSDGSSIRPIRSPH